MSILNVNQIQPVGSGQTITISASDITASSATITASSVTANLTGNVTGNLTGNVTSSSTSTFSSGLNVTGGAVGIRTDSPIAERLDIRTSDLTNIHQDLSSAHRGVFIGGDSDTVVQIASNNDGSVGSGVVLTNMGSSADGRHWVMQHGATSESNKFTLGYVTTSSDRATNLMTSAQGSGADLTITTGGNIGIGTDNPTAHLHLNSSGATQILINTTSSSSEPQIILQDTAASDYFAIQKDGRDLRFKPQGSEALRITSSGNVGIGTDNPQARLHVNTTIDDSDAPQWAFHLTQDDPLNSINQIGGSGIGILFKPATNNAPAIGAGIAAEKPGASDDDTTTDLVFYTSQNDETLDEAVRITSDGYFTMSAQPAAMVYKTGVAQSITANAIYNYDATAISQGGMTINASRNRITVPVAGKYMISAASSGSVTTASAGDGWRLRLLRDGAAYGSTYLYPIETTGSEVGQEFSLQFSIVVNAAADDYFEVQIENVGGARATMNYGYFSIYLLG